MVVCVIMHNMIVNEERDDKKITRPEGIPPGVFIKVGGEN
jgi:hypothetical protein